MLSDQIAQNEERLRQNGWDRTRIFKAVDQCRNDARSITNTPPENPASVSAFADPPWINVDKTGNYSFVYMSDRSGWHLTHRFDYGKLWLKVDKDVFIARQEFGDYAFNHRVESSSTWVIAPDSYKGCGTRDSESWFKSLSACLLTIFAGSMLLLSPFMYIRLALAQT
jgi:hypothetical protein